MTLQEIWMLPVEERLLAFIERWKLLDERTGSRTVEEIREMGEIADAIMPELIRRNAGRP
jgi:hypothetical protein